MLFRSDVLAGARNAYRDVSLCNAAAALVVAGKADNVRDAMALASHSIDSGAASAALDTLIAVSNQAKRD